jgi:hypothetical protein
MVKIDECETTIFSDSSIIINTTRKDLLCFDFSDILILLQEANRLRDINQSGTNLKASLFKKIEIFRNNRC